MRRFGVVLLSLLLIFGLCACRIREQSEQVDETPVTDTEQAIVAEEPVVTDAESETVKPADNLEITEVTLTEEQVTAMIEHLKDCSYIMFMQNVENGIVGERSYSITRYSVSMNTVQKIHSISMKYIRVNGEDMEGVGYKLFSDGTQTLFSRNGVWEEANAEEAELALDMTQFENVKDVFDYLVRDIKQPIGVVGKASGDYWQFEIADWQPADSIIEGLPYDELGSTTYKFTYRLVDDILRPDSVTVHLEYKVDDVLYYIESTIQVNSVGNVNISTPSVGDSA